MTVVWIIIIAVVQAWLLTQKAAIARIKDKAREAAAHILTITVAN